MNHIIQQGLCWHCKVTPTYFFGVRSRTNCSPQSPLEKIITISVHKVSSQNWKRLTSSTLQTVAQAECFISLFGKRQHHFSSFLIHLSSAIILSFWLVNCHGMVGSTFAGNVSRRISRDYLLPFFRILSDRCLINVQLRLIRLIFAGRGITQKAN